MKISIIAAIATSDPKAALRTKNKDFLSDKQILIPKKAAIGINNTLPWHLPEDLKNFKRLTNGHPIIMGRKTFDSIGRALPGRTNIVISRNSSWQHDGCLAATSLDDAINLAKKENPAEIFIIGGAQIYAEAMSKADRLYLTKVNLAVRYGDAFFPKFDSKKEWKEIERHPYRRIESLFKDTTPPPKISTNHDFDFVIYERIR